MKKFDNTGGIASVRVVPLMSQGGSAEQIPLQSGGGSGGRVGRFDSPL